MPIGGVTYDFDLIESRVTVTVNEPETARASYYRLRALVAPSDGG